MTKLTKAGRMSHKVSIYDAKSNLSKLIDKVNQGERVEITNRGKVVAELVPPKPKIPNNGHGILAGVFPDFDWEEDKACNATFNPDKFC